MITSSPALAEPTNTGLSLDLTSKNASIAATTVGKTGVAINVGGTTGVVGTGAYSTLTPAEYLAALQVVSTGHQTLNLNSSGQAVSGTFTLPSANNLASLVVPTGVTGVYNIASSNQLNVTGNFTNSGSFYVVSSSQGANSAVLNAVNIVNNQGALLSSVLPAGGLAGFTNLISSLNLTLNAINNISNFGSITSSGSLNMIAGNQIINSNAASAALANISAVNNISMIAPHIDNSGQIVSALNNIRIQSANLVNSGLLDSVKGNISISNLVQKVLDINNVGGLIEAKNTLSITNRSTSTLSAINFEGGIIEASKIRFVDKKGSVFVALDDISNKVAFTAQHVGLDVSNGSSGLTLTGLSKAADVTLSFNGSGNVTSTGFNTLGQDVNINTTGTIKITGNIVTTPSAAGDAGSVILNAGQSLTTKDITTNGSGTGNGGSITLTAGTSLNAGALSASGGINGNPGIITLATKTGNATVSNIVDNGVAGGGVVSITTPGSIAVSGGITALDGTVTLNSASTNISKIDVGTDGHLNINPNSSSGAPYVLDLGQLAQIGSGNVTIGGGSQGSNANIVINQNCDQCLGDLTSVTVKTNGSYTATGTTLTLGADQSFSVVAGGAINTGTVSGGQNISFQSASTVTVDGSISSSGGNVTLTGTGFDVKAPVNVGSGSVTLQATSSTKVDGAQLGNITASNLTISGTSQNANVTLSGNTDLSKISDHVVVAVGGNFDSGSSPITLSNNALLSIAATKVTTGDITGGGGLAVHANQTLDVTGNINMPNGPIALNGDLSGQGASINLDSGKNITGSQIVISSVKGNITTGSNIAAVGGSLTISSGGSLKILDKSNISALQDVKLGSMNELAIDGWSGSGSGIKISAGTLAGNFDPFNTNATFDTSKLGSSGKIIIDSFQNGAGTGSLNISNAQIVAMGNGQDGSGSLTLVSGANMNVSYGTKLAAIGGNLSLSSASNLDLNGGSLVSVASSSSTPGSGYNGGQIGIMAGAASTDMAALLSSLSATRTNKELVSTDISLAGNTESLTNGSVLSVVTPAGIHVAMNSNTLTLNGGVVYIDPPPSANVNINGSNINAVGPGIAAPALTIDSSGVIPVLGSTGGTGGNTGSTGSTGGTGSTGSTGIGGTGSLGGNVGGTLTNPVITNPGGTLTTGVSSGLSSGTGFTEIFSSGAFPASSATSTDLSTRTSSSQQQLVGSVNFNGQSVVPSDTLDETTSKPNMRQSSFCSKPQLLKAKDSVEDDSWIIASSSCQPFTFEEHDGSLIVGTGPAKIAPAADRTLLLREGKILVLTVDKIHVVRTPFCNITIPVNTATIVDVSPKGLVNITNLAGGKTSITVCRNDETLILSASPGEQLVLAESGVPEEDFSNFGFPQVTHNKVGSWQLELSGLRGQKVRFDRTEMAAQEPLLHCSVGCVNQVQLRRIEQLMQSMSSQDTVLKSMGTMGKSKQKLLSTALPATEDQLRPVAFQDLAMLSAPVSLNTIHAGSAVVKYIGRCKVALTSPGLIAIEEGEALISAHSKTVIKMGDAHVELKPGTVAIVGRHDGMLKVRNLLEKTSTSALTTVAGKKIIGLQVGQELIVGPKGVSMKKALGQDPVGRRRVSCLDLQSGHTCYSSEISLSSLMQNSSILAQLLRSDDIADQALAKRIMKMAVCVSLVTSSHGNYNMNP